MVTESFVINISLGMNYHTVLYLWRQEAKFWIRLEVQINCFVNCCFFLFKSQYVTLPTVTSKDTKAAIHIKVNTWHYRQSLQKIQKQGFIFFVINAFSLYLLNLGVLNYLNVDFPDLQYVQEHLKCYITSKNYSNHHFPCTQKPS